VANQRAPVEGAFGGLLMGLLTAPILIIFGTLLCLTGLGAILGVPLILGAIFAPLLGPMIGLGALKGECPWCGASLGAITSKQSFDCSHCNQRVLIRNRKFVRATG
jgi:DNA-directed RNA polymerase subunit RPC12/RpoP